MNGKVSIIIPAYNSEKYIKKCLDSILEQTYKNYEIIIVNDGSTDNTSKIIDEYKNEYEFIKVINISNHGQGYARNIALSQASGDYILFLDSDDFIEDVTLEVTTKKIEEEKSDLVFFDWKYYYESDKTYKYVNTEIFFGKKFLVGEEILDLFKIKHYFTVNKLYSKEFLLSNNIKYGEGYIYEDNPFWVKVVISAKKVSIIQSPLYNVRVNESSTTRSNTNTDKHYKGFIKAIEEIIKLTRTKPEYDYYYLYNYLIKKFNLYYKKRVANKYKKEFLYDLVDIMSQAVEIKDTNVNNKLIKYGFKYNIFKEKRKFLFYILYKLFLIESTIKKIIKKSVNKTREFLDKIIVKNKRYNYIEYKKALRKPKQDTILFMGFDYRYTGNSRYLFEMMLQEKVENLFFVTKSNLVDEKYRIKPKSKEMYKKIYNSKIIIFESWTPKNLEKMEDSIWIQLWHGTPLKKMLFDSEEREIAIVNNKHKNEKYKDISKWDYLTIDNPNIYKYFKTAYLIPEEKILVSGYPRVDFLLKNRDNVELKNQIREKAQIPKEKKVVVYLPTWRDYNYGTDKTKMDFKYFIDAQKLSNLLGNDYTIVSKNHAFLNNEIANKITNIDIETQELLLIADYLITDYSSVMFDAFAIDIPVIIFANDYEKYSNSRGVYESIWKDLMPYVSYNEEEVANKILSYQLNSEQYKDIKKKYSYQNNIDLVKFILNIREKLSKRTEK